jgi:hypothetical protein
MVAELVASCALAGRWKKARPTMADAAKAVGLRMKRLFMGYLF